MNSIVSDMLMKYRGDGDFDKHQAFREVAQQILLSALAQTDFFHRAAFYGGTCLRLFYGLDRFSEDLDFGITSNDPSFDLADYLPAIDKTFSSLGIAMQSSIRNKKQMTGVKSAYAEGKSRDILIELFPSDERIQQIVFNQKIRIKFDVEADFIDGAGYEYKPLLLPFYSRIRCYDKESLFAGKIAAALSRNWKNRAKGRDFYDFAFYVSRDIRPNLSFLEMVLRHERFLLPGQKFNPAILKSMLEERIKGLDIEQVKKDVKPFLSDHSKLSYWSKDYFLDLSSAIKL